MLLVLIGLVAGTSAKQAEVQLDLPFSLLQLELAGFVEFVSVQLWLGQCGSLSCIARSGLG